MSSESLTATTSAATIVKQMMVRDEFSRWLGVSIVEVAESHVVTRMVVRAEMVNGFGITHGGIVYSLADSTFAFAANLGSKVAVAVDCSMSYPKAVHPGDILEAHATVQTATRSLRFCEVTVRNQNGIIVGIFRGTAFVTSQEHSVQEG